MTRRVCHLLIFCIFSQLTRYQKDWEQLPGKEKSFICSSVAILSANDCWMETVLVAKLSDDIQIPEARCFFGFMIMQRNIHSELFTVMLDMFTDGFSDRDAILESCKNCTNFHSKFNPYSNSLYAVSGMQSRKAWVERYITDTTDHFSVRILASAFYNYMSYLTITDTLMHVTRAAEQGGEKVKLPGLVRSLSKFQRDHKSYYEFYSIISDILVNKVPQKQAETMARELVGIESMFMDELMELAGGSLELAGTKVNPKLIKERLGYHADLCLAGMGYRSVYKTKDPLPWIAEAILREARKDDHEHGIQGPTKANVQATPKKTMEEQVFSLSDDF